MDYFINFIDDYFRHQYVYFTQHKSNALEKFNEYKKVPLDRKIKFLNSDEGGEYILDEGGEYILDLFQNFCKEHGITHLNTIKWCC